VGANSSLAHRFPDVVIQQQRSSHLEDRRRESPAQRGLGPLWLNCELCASAQNFPCLCSDSLFVPRPLV